MNYFFILPGASFHKPTAIAVVSEGILSKIAFVIPRMQRRVAGLVDSIGESTSQLVNFDEDTKQLVKELELAQNSQVNVNLKVLINQRSIKYKVCLLWVDGIMFLSGFVHACTCIYFVFYKKNSPKDFMTNCHMM